MSKIISIKMAEEILNKDKFMEDYIKKYLNKVEREEGGFYIYIDYSKESTTRQKYYNYNSYIIDPKAEYAYFSKLLELLYIECTEKGNKISSRLDDYLKEKLREHMEWLISTNSFDLSIIGQKKVLNFILNEKKLEKRGKNVSKEDMFNEGTKKLTSKSKKSSKATHLTKEDKGR